MDIVLTGWEKTPTVFENPREGKFPVLDRVAGASPAPTAGIAVLDFDHDGWMDLALRTGPPA